MDIVEEIKEIIARQSPHRKAAGLNKVNDIFEYNQEYAFGYDLNEDIMTESVKILLSSALQEEDQEMKQRFFRTLFQAVVYRPGKYILNRIDWDPLAASLSSLDKWQLLYVLVVLGLTAQEKYVSLLNEYTHHADPDISTRAINAIDEIKSAVARATQRAQQENKGDASNPL